MARPISFAGGIDARCAEQPLRISDVVINEILFNPLSGDDADTYVELHNRSDEAVDVSDWRFVDGIQFIIPDGTIIPAGVTWWLPPTGTGCSAAIRI
jgi:hypothetical protein